MKIAVNDELLRRAIDPRDYPPFRRLKEGCFRSEQYY